MLWSDVVAVSGAGLTSAVEPKGMELARYQTDAAQSSDAATAAEEGKGRGLKQRERCAWVAAPLGLRPDPLAAHADVRAVSVLQSRIQLRREPE
jgi:hypothetical protein